MSKEEYAEALKRIVYHYNQGKKDERNRILKLIDEELKKWEVDDLQIIALTRVKRELSK